MRNALLNNVLSVLRSVRSGTLSQKKNAQRRSSHVGVGKTMLADILFASLSRMGNGVLCRRVHFNSFLLELYSRLHRYNLGEERRTVPVHATAGIEMDPAAELVAAVPKPEEATLHVADGDFHDLRRVRGLERERLHFVP